MVVPLRVREANIFHLHRIYLELHHRLHRKVRVATKLPLRVGVLVVVVEPEVVAHLLATKQPHRVQIVHGDLEVVRVM